MRLIDADTLEKQIKGWYCDPERCDSYNGVRCRACYIDDALSEIDRAPAIDAVPVVRCGECRHRLGCLISDGPDGKKNWFCADGEREEQTTMEEME